MREQVCVILNEREVEKHKLAASILEQLNKFSITASRLSITEKILEIINLRCPKILILDYLLGDYTTGLDIVYTINKLPQEIRPVVFFITDEPSVQVAVEAMRLGVKNYFQMDRKDSLNKLIDEILGIIKADDPKKKIQGKRKFNLSDFISQSESSLRTLNEIKTIIKKSPKLIFIKGAPGSGKSFLSEVLHSSVFPDNFIKNIDLKFFTKELNSIFGYFSNYSYSKLNSFSFSLTLENAEEDNGEILYNLKRITNLKNNKQKDFLIVVTSQCAETLKAWNSALEIETIILPELEKRQMDFAPLILSFIAEAEKTAHFKFKRLSPEVITKVSGLKWPGNIKQLKSVLIDAIIETQHSEESLLEIIQNKKSKWESYNTQLNDNNLTIDAFVAAKTLESANNNYRIAAAKLGCGINSLQKALKI